ncbi:MAG: MFS transporter [Desulfarculales bacterium]|nr:MFS transporter [Desulfarculales bacterium]
MVFDSMDLYLLAFALPMILNEWGLTTGSAGWITSAAMWGMIVGAYGWGYLSDRLGRRLCLQSTILIYAIFTGLCALALGPISLFIARFLTGTGLGGMVPVDYAVVAEFVPAKHRGRFLACAVTIWPMGGLIGAFVALNLTEVFGWQVLFVVGALPALMVFIIRRWIPESSRFLLSTNRPEEAEKVVWFMEERSGITDHKPLEAPEDGDFSIYKDNPPSFFELFKKQFIVRTIVVWGVWFAHCVPYYAVGLWLPTLMTKYFGIERATTFKIMMLVVCVGIVGRACCMLLIEKAGRKALLIVYSLCGAVCMCIYPQAGDTTQLIIIACCASFFYEGIWCAIVPYTAENYPTHIRSTASGAASAAGRWAAVVGPIFVGYALNLNSLGLLFYTFAVCMVILAILVYVLGRETAGKSLEELGNN